MDKQAEPIAPGSNSEDEQCTCRGCGKKYSISELDSNGDCAICEATECLLTLEDDWIYPSDLIGSVYPPFFDMTRFDDEFDAELRTVTRKYFVKHGLELIARKAVREEDEEDEGGEGGEGGDEADGVDEDGVAEGERRKGPVAKYWCIEMDSLRFANTCICGKTRYRPICKYGGTRDTERFQEGPCHTFIPEGAEGPFNVSNMVLLRLQNDGWARVKP